VLRRVERTSIAACVAMAIVAWMLARGRFSAPLGVLGGGLLGAISYRGIKGGIDAAMRWGDSPRVRSEIYSSTPPPASTEISPSDDGEADGEVRRRRSVAIGLVKSFTRYAILTAAAYVIMARL